MFQSYAGGVNYILCPAILFTVSFFCKGSGINGFDTVSLPISFFLLIMLLEMHSNSGALISFKRLAGGTCSNFFSQMNAGQIDTMARGKLDGRDCVGIQ